ncbi:MAG: biotin/lipoyl-containing protein, partial [Erythrobacter sp.]|nr:biotin/lipoyl-containing protein [Erythrobacter sp.]
VASGEPLPCTQADLAIRGHAFEARLYAEDVPAGFLPATGRLSHLVFPDGVRADTGVRAGDVISPWYDPMIAKLVVQGPTRAIALARLARALDDTQVAGSVTNLAFLAALARHPGFVAGDVDTGLIERDLATLGAAPQASAAIRVVALLEAADLPRDPLIGFALWSCLRRRIDLRLGSEEVAGEITVLGPDLVRVLLDGKVHEARRTALGWGIGGDHPPGAVVRAGGMIHVFGHGVHAGTFSFAHPDPLDRVGAAAVTGNLTLSPMPGLVRAVFVTAGQTVAQGDRLAALEAMKMEHVLCAARDGVVAEVLVIPGAQVEAGAALIRLEDSDV